MTNIIAPDGTAQKGYSYDELGKTETNGDDNFLNEVTYTGSVRDEIGGLNYMRARFFSPETGTFLTQDTYTGNPYDPRTQHLYSYCGNNPTSMVDPTGHRAEYVYDPEQRIMVPVTSQEGKYWKETVNGTVEGSWNVFADQRLSMGLWTPLIQTRYCLFHLPVRQGIYLADQQTIIGKGLAMSSGMRHEKYFVD